MFPRWPVLARLVPPLRNIPATGALQALRIGERLATTDGP